MALLRVSLAAGEATKILTDKLGAYRAIGAEIYEFVNSYPEELKEYLYKHLISFALEDGPERRLLEIVKPLPISAIIQIDYYEVILPLQVDALSHKLKTAILTHRAEWENFQAKLNSSWLYRLFGAK